MIARTCRENLLALAVAYAKATGSSLEQVSKKFYGNRSFLRAFRARQQSVSIDKFDEMVGAFREEWPDGTDWPMTRAAMIARPQKKIPGKRAAVVVEPARIT